MNRETLKEPAQTSKTRAIVCDDSFLVRKGLVETLESLGIEVIGQASNGLEAIDLYKKMQPDVVLMDIRMSEMDGLEATKEISFFDQTAKIIILTWSEVGHNVVEAARNGARGFLIHGQFTDQELKRAIDMVLRGDAVIASRMTSALVDTVRLGRYNAKNSFLTKREQEMLDLRQTGLTYIQIADKLGITEKTVRNGLSRIASVTIDTHHKRVSDLLTERERDVAALLREKYSIAQIALKLGVTEKTVKNHAGTAVSKLGLNEISELRKVDFGENERSYYEHFDDYLKKDVN